MRKYEKRFKEVLVDVVCDCCGGSCSRSPACAGSAEYGVLEADWGYWSRKDGESFRRDLCEDCFDKVVKFLSSISEEKN